MTKLDEAISVSYVSTTESGQDCIITPDSQSAEELLKAARAYRDMQPKTIPEEFMSTNIRYLCLHEGEIKIMHRTWAAHPKNKTMMKSVFINDCGRVYNEKPEMFWNLPEIPQPPHQGEK